MVGGGDLYIMMVDSRLLLHLISPHGSTGSHAMNAILHFITHPEFSVLIKSTLSSNALTDRKLTVVWLMSTKGAHEHFVWRQIK